MNQDRWNKLQELFENASQLPQQEQYPYVHRGAGDDAELSDQVIRMLERDARASFLDRGIDTVAYELFSELEVQPLDKIGPYLLLYQLGAGGMGVVYLAERPDWQAGPRRFNVALKIPRDVWISPDRLKRFQDEQRLLAQLVHPSIARIYEAGTLTGGTPWFAMEYVNGEPITQYCKSHASSIRDRLHLILDVCDAAQYAHRQAIIHRDLKPSNILVTPAGEVKLLDFGIAKQIGGSLSFSTATRVGLHPLTLAYAAPEQVLENDVSTQTDVYSIGVILYELMTGKLPFDFSQLKISQVEQAVQTREPERPSLAAGVRSRTGEWADLDVLILTAMHKDKAKRYGSIDALRRDITNYLKYEPLEAQADSFRYRCGKFLQRRRGPVLLATAVLCLIIGLFTFYTATLAQARDAAEAEANRTRTARQFTADLLQGDDPEVGPSKDLRVIDLLEPGLKKAKALKGDPIQQAELYSTIGTLFVNFGELNKGEAALHSAYRLLISASAAKSHEMAEVLAELAELYVQEEQTQHAEACMRKAVAIEEALVPADKHLIYKYKTGIASVLVESKPKEALLVLTQLLNQPAGTADDELRSDVWNLLSTAYINLGEYDQAEPFGNKVLDYLRKTRPPNHPDVATQLVNVSRIQDHRKEYKAEERSLREALQIDQAWYGKDHPESGDVMRFLAETLFKEKRFDEAQLYAHQAVDDEQKAYGDTNRRTAFALQIAGRLALEQGSLNEAESDLTREVKALRAVNDPVNLPRSLAYLGDAYLRQHRYSQAVAAYQEAVALFPASILDHTEQLAQTNHNLAEALRHLNTSRASGAVE